MPGENCSTCFYGRSALMEGAAAPAMVCKRNPPIAVLASFMAPPSVKNPQGGIANRVMGYQAPVTADTWCGEYRAKPSSRPES